VHRGHLETRHLAEQAGSLADFEGVKTTLRATRLAIVEGRSDLARVVSDTALIGSKRPVWIGSFLDLREYRVETALNKSSPPINAQI
jgi:hypothetical protein